MRQHMDDLGLCVNRCVRHRCELGIRVLPLPLSISSVLQKHAETLRAAVSSGYSLCDARLAHCADR